MSIICRTCLQKSNKTFKTNQSIEDFGGGEVKISIVLRFCMPELYLGLSSNPEICYECKESLKVAYLFKKKCLRTENIIGNFLKNARCTAKSVDLHDVLSYFNEQAQLELEVEKAKQRVSLNAQEIISEWDEISDEAVNNEKIIPEVRQSAPNPANSTNYKFDNKSENKNKMKFCHETGLFFDQQGQFYDCSGYRVDINQIRKDDVKIGNDEVINHKETTIGASQITKDHPEFVQDTGDSDNFCKITSVFSLSADSTDKDPVSDINDADGVSVANKVNIANNTNETSNLNDAVNTSESLVDIKQEPMEVEMNGRDADFNYYPTDEETLDASETASYEDMQCTSRLQGIIDNLPEINDSNQYVDVPEFVHINNFGLKELEELRRQQQNDGETGNKNIVLNFKNKLPPKQSSDSNEKETKTEESKEESSQSGFTKVPLSTLPEVLVINGKKMVKCSEGYRLMEDPSSKPVQILTRVRKLTPRTNSSTQAITKKFYSLVPEGYFNEPFPKSVDLESTIGPKPVSCSEKITEIPKLNIKDHSKENSDVSVDLESKPGPGKPVGRRKKIKMVPVSDNKFKFCSQKGAKLDLKIGKASPSKNVKIAPAGDDRDVVVLFTNYTIDGEYINDHDYLVNPYKRNKVLIEEEKQWFCMCYICHTKHHVYDHVPHMKTHTSKCKICRVDLGTPYMLNVHVKVHSKPCRQCTERVPYGLKESHEEEHFKDELEFENRKKKRAYHNVRGRPRKVIKDEAQLPSPIKKTEPEPEEEETKLPEEFVKVPLVEEPHTDDSSEDEEWRKTGNPSKKPRKRRRRYAKNDAESVVVERSSRVLRSNVRKYYSETECEDLIASNLKMMSSSL